MKIKLLTLAFAALFVLRTDIARAQQDPYNTHYAFNRMLYNPAVAGSKGRWCFTALSHYQYTGYEDRTLEFWPTDPNNPTSPPGSATKAVGPKTQMFSFTAPISQYGGLGIGFIKDKLGYESSTHLKIDAAGRLPLQKRSAPTDEVPELSLGFEVNFLQKGLDGTRLKPLAPLDPSIPNTMVTDRHPVFSGGLYYTNPMTNSGSWKDLWAGFSTMNLNSPQFVYGNNNVFSTPKMHSYLMGGISKTDFLGNSNLVFHPSVMMKFQTVFQMDATALVEYQSKFWGGLAYRTTVDAFSVMLGYSGFSGNFQGLRIGYSYDLTLSKILNVSSGTHELQLNYCFIVKIVPPPVVPVVTPPFMHREED